MDPLVITHKVRQKARELGFDGCGFSRAGKLDKEARRLEQWLNEGRHGTMDWMENNFDKRIDPTRLVPGSKSVVSLLASYRFEKNELDDKINPGPKIAKYARGRDYHKTFKSRLKKLFRYTKEQSGGLEGRIFVDSAPVMDKAWAEKSGLGWMGKNGNMLNKDLGSWFLIGEMIVDIPFVYDAPVAEHCGSCTRCIDACPTNAIYEPYRIDSERCISYLTIELKDKIPESKKAGLGEWAFGCDICQDVCPWNRKADYSSVEDFTPREQVLRPPESKNWSEITPDEFDIVFEGTPIRRAKHKWFTRNAKIAEQNIISGSG
ncbi:tRNA epoxyqueuosine(34) reductase QueG [Rhodohalobacter sp. SW132]|uniref:tRNA epoxyqueuosine(34) reductase QueG n=1 Tax=Rhodohalobacter sp. SW132 TaxID=2293433 RepID=UPI000E23AD1C|nr:tRNA epoxyqueuosine(34) reductase QueG [Rhodohalobacter sp. SW132]REL37640.1 tRNA epoxyqueuosine(34) reductase QueG [Rhodohalobacter sp. SW132]